jgi:hypothetical protein
MRILLKICCFIYAYLRTLKPVINRVTRFN